MTKCDFCEWSIPIEDGHYKCNSGCPVSSCAKAIERMMETIKENDKKEKKW